MVGDPGVVTATTVDDAAGSTATAAGAETNRWSRPGRGATHIDVGVDERVRVRRLGKGASSYRLAVMSPFWKVCWQVVSVQTMSVVG